MAQRITLRIKITLLSDAVFSSGNSVPGGEDISVYTDKDGYPYYKATSFKGILRQEAENYLNWTNGNKSTLDFLFGKEGREYTDEERRLTFTDFILQNKEQCIPDDCYTLRAFTQMENGAAKDGSLRTAKCIIQGLTFAGDVECSDSDKDLVSKVVSAVKWIGTMRNKGFGRVKTTVISTDLSASPCTRIDNAKIIKYTITTEQPVVINHFSAGTGNYDKTRPYIPGSVLRGLIAGKLTNDPDIGNILSDKVRFLNALPLIDGKNSVPSPSGYYEDKSEKTRECILNNGNLNPGLKRAKIGSYCLIDDDKFRYTNVETNGRLRINLKDKEPGSSDNKMFETSYIEQGQTFVGYIVLDDVSLSGKITSVGGNTVNIGADRYEGFGKCSLMFEPSDFPYDGIKCTNENNIIFMLAVSPITMIDENGEPCGINLNELAKKLGIESVSIDLCSTSVSEYGSFNRTWECRSPGVKMYNPGSTFKLKCSSAPSVDNMRAIERECLGIRRAEGYGQVLFINLPIENWDKEKADKNDNDRKDRIEKHNKRKAKIEETVNVASEVDHCIKSDVNKNGLSTSQLADIELALLKNDKYGFYQMVENKINKKRSNEEDIKKRYSDIKKIIDIKENDAPTLCAAIRHSRRKQKNIKGTV